MSEQKQLLPCPFCGSKNVILDGKSDFCRVRCVSCFSESRNFYFDYDADPDNADKAESEAITAWNARAQQPVADTQSIRNTALEEAATACVNQGSLNWAWRDAEARCAEAIRELKSASQQPVAEQEPVAWEATTVAYKKYITQTQYEDLSPRFQKWYKPYKCSGCTSPQPAQPVPADTARLDWLEQSHAQTFRFRSTGNWRISDDFAPLAEGKTLREAIDAAMLSAAPDMSQNKHSVDMIDEHVVVPDAEKP